MSEGINNLIFGVAAAFVVPAVTFILGVTWSRLVGGWKDRKFRRWWTIFCLAMPFIALGMMGKRMAEDNFQGIRAVWSTEPLHVVVIAGVVIGLSITVAIALVRVWRGRNALPKHEP